MIVHTEQVMGTIFSFHIDPGDCPSELAHAAVASACARLHDLDDIFSTWKPQSPLSLLRRGELTLDDAPREVGVVLDLCEQARTLSKAWFDPWAMPGGLDPSGLVKGWATEQALMIVRSAGTRAALVNGGGDIAVLGIPEGERSFRIGVRHPWRPDALACVLETDRAVATSGCYERGPHLINPKNGSMLFATASATVVGPSLWLCDALATALVVAEGDGPELAGSLVDYDSYIVHSDGTEFATDGILFATDGEAVASQRTPVATRL